MNVESKNGDGIKSSLIFILFFGDKRLKVDECGN